MVAQQLKSVKTANRPVSVQDVIDELKHFSFKIIVQKFNKKQNGKMFKTFCSNYFATLRLIHNLLVGHVLIYASV